MVVKHFYLLVDGETVEVEGNYAKCNQMAHHILKKRPKSTVFIVIRVKNETD